MLIHSTDDFRSVEAALREIAAGNFIVVVDDENRENEGDLIMAAEKVTPERIAFMVRHTSGIICVPMLAERLNALRLHQMASNNTESMRTAFTVSVDYRIGTTTGVSAADRCRTIEALVDPRSQAEDFAHPGHVFPLRYREGGVLRRTGHTEASVDLVKLAGLQPAAVLSELVSDDGSMMRLPQLKVFAQQHGFKLISIADLIAFRRAKEKLIRHLSEDVMETRYGTFKVHTYDWFPDGSRAYAFVLGEVADQRNVLVRVHRGCIGGDVFESTSCSCGQSLRRALSEIQSAGQGVILYLGSDPLSGRYLQHAASPRPPIDERDLGIGAQILSDLKLTTLRLLTNSSVHYPAIKGYGLEVVERVPLVADAEPEGEREGRTAEKRS